MFWSSKKGSENLDTRFLFSVFIFLGTIVFLGSMFATSQVNDEMMNISSIDKPPQVSGGILDWVIAIPSLIGYIFGVINGLSSTNPAIMLVVIIPIGAVMLYIFLRLIKPFS